jgi:hypothetical protein
VEPSQLLAVIIMMVYKSDPNIKGLMDGSAQSRGLLAEGLLEDETVKVKNKETGELEDKKVNKGVNAVKKDAKKQATSAAKDAALDIFVHDDSDGAADDVEGALTDAPFKLFHVFTGALSKTKTGVRVTKGLSLGRKLAAEAAIIGSLFASGSHVRANAHHYTVHNQVSPGVSAHAPAIRRHPPERILITWLNHPP